MPGQVHDADNGMSRPFRTNRGLIRSGFASGELGEMTPAAFHNRLCLLGR